MVLNVRQISTYIIRYFIGVSNSLNFFHWYNELLSHYSQYYLDSKNCVQSFNILVPVIFLEGRGFRCALSRLQFGIRRNYFGWVFKVFIMEVIGGRGKCWAWMDEGSQLLNTQHYKLMVEQYIDMPAVIGPCCAKTHSCGHQISERYHAARDNNTHTHKS